MPAAAAVDQQKSSSNTPAPAAAQKTTGSSSTPAAAAAGKQIGSSSMAAAGKQNGSSCTPKAAACGATPTPGSASGWLNKLASAFQATASTPPAAAKVPAAKKPTPCSMAIPPRGYDSKVDVYSVGITSLVMFAGGEGQLSSREGLAAFRAQVAGYVSGQAGQLKDFWAPTELSILQDQQVQDFFSKICCKDPDKRWSARQLLQHPWLSKE